jgi:uncharacterized protein (DUF1684 family)
MLHPPRPTAAVAGSVREPQPTETTLDVPPDGEFMLALAAALTLAVPVARPVGLDPAAADSITRAIEKDRNDTREWLKSAPNSYLATVQRRDFEDRSTLTVGRAPGNDVRVDDPGIEPHHLRVTVRGDSFLVEGVDPAARFKVKDVEYRTATLGPSGIGVGRFMLRLSHQRFPAIIVFDPRSPRFKEYKGLKYYPVDLSYRFVLELRANPKPDTVVILSTRGNQRHALRVGWFDFVVRKTRCRLEATRLLEPGVGEQDLGVFFRDFTSGRETYPLGRYVDVVPLADGRYLLDFNNAYNPACAVSDHYNCPIPPRGNLLGVPIRAGEMDSHYH